MSHSGHGFQEVYLYVSSLKGTSRLESQCKRPNKTFMLVKNDTVQWAKKKVSVPSLSGTHW